MTIGREPTNRVSILDPSISRRHCVVRQSAGKIILTDLGSRNGTFVNGVPVKERVLTDGDEICIGDTLFVFLTTDLPLTAFASTLQFDTRAIAASSPAESAGPAGAAAASQDRPDLRRLEWLERENSRIQADVNLNHNLVGESRSMLEVLQAILRVAPTEATVLIRGESGTGKEMAARAIHRNSRRAAKPFVAINCAALPEQLLESELFGHEKGAFTGAYIQKKGRVEMADGGTLFLDEVADLTLPCQAKLLRMLQEREFERVGGTRAVRVDIRLVAATNRELEGAVRNGSFRQDLFYRINVVPVTMPPLRERRDDIPLLARYFAAKYSTQCKRPPMKISPEAIACLTQYDWPGNVRELENAIERAVVLASGEAILPEDLPEAVLDTGVADAAALGRFHDSVREAKKLAIRKAVEQAGGNIAEAAALLGLQRTYLHRLMRNLDLR